MPRMLAALALVALAPLLFAQSLFTGEPVPLTNTRYEVVQGIPRLISNGSETFLFWTAGTHVRFTRIDAWGSAPPSRAIMPVTGGDTFDVVWTGSHFLLLVGQTFFTSTPADDRIVGQLIDASGELVGLPFLVLDGGQFPRIAFDGESVLVLCYYYDQYLGSPISEVLMLRLRPDGTPLMDAPQRTGVFGFVQGLASNGQSFAAVVAHQHERKLVMFDKSGAVTKTTLLRTDYAAWASIRAGGERYLLVDTAGGDVHTRLVEPDGSLGPPLSLHELRGGNSWSVVVWTGSKWVVAFELPWRNHSSFAVVQLNAENTTVESRQERDGPVPSMAFTAGRVLVTLSQYGWPDFIRVAELPLPEGSGATVSYSAAEQRLRAVAPAVHATLVLWWEGSRLYAGLRASDGEWSEREIAVGHDAVAAASDGDGFAAVLTSNDGRFVLRLDRNGAPLGEAVPLPSGMDPYEILWTGRDYAVIALTNELGFVAIRLNGAGTWSEPVKVPSPWIASNGNGFYAVFLLSPGFQTPPLPPHGVAGTRLGPDFQPLDAAPTTLALERDGSAGFYGADVVWDGTQYVVAWNGDRGVTAARISADGGAPVVHPVSTFPSEEVRLAQVSGGVALLWPHYEAWPGPASLQAAFLSRDGSLSPQIELRPDLAPPSNDRIEITALPNGDTALIETAVRHDAPVEGSRRVTITVLSAVPLPQRPASPRVTAVKQGEIVTLRWQPPSQPVNGYRVEYRLGDQPWIEIDHQLPADQRVVSVRLRENISFRVRAFNDAGLGEYSSVVTPKAVKRRRAVR